MSRRRRERALALRPPDPLDRTRALARFGRLVGRAVTFGFVPCGPVVEATGSNGDVLHLTITVNSYDQQFGGAGFILESTLDGQDNLTMGAIGN